MGTTKETVERLTSLIVGCGNIGGRFDQKGGRRTPPLTHAGAFAQHPGYSLIGCIDPDLSTLKSFGKFWQIPNQYPSLEAFSDTGIFVDVISICSPTQSHVRDVLGAISLKPRAIFCEKPLSDSVERSREMVRRCRDSGILLAVNYGRRWDTQLQKFAQDLNSGIWGEVRSVSGVYNKGLLNNGSHMIDVMHLLFGKVRLVEVGTARFDHYPEDPSVPLILKSGTGIEIFLGCSDARDFSHFEFTITTSKAQISVENGGLRWRIRGVDTHPVFPGYKTLGRSTVKPGKFLNSMQKAVAEIHDALTRGVSISSSGENALAAEAICWQAYKKLKKRAPTRSP